MLIIKKTPEFCALIFNSLFYKFMLYTICYFFDYNFIIDQCKMIKNVAKNFFILKFF